MEKLKPSTEERPKPKEPAEIIDIESARKRKEWKESRGEVSALGVALELIQEGHISNQEDIDKLESINEKEKILLKKALSQFKELEELRNKK